MENNSKKYISLARLSDFLDKIKEKYSQIGHKHELNDITDYKVDSSLSSTSTNPVQNKVIDAEFNAIGDAMGALELAIDGKADASHIHTVSDVSGLQSALDAKDVAIENAKKEAANKDAVVLYETQKSIDAVQTQLDATKVPITRTINGKALDADIVLTAEDIGIENLIQLETTPEDIIEWMCEENSIIPVASSNGEVYTTNDGKILII